MTKEDESQVWRSRSYVSASSKEEVHHVNHVIMFLSSVSISRGACGPYPFLSIRPITRPCYRGVKLLRVRPHISVGILAPPIKALVQLYLSPKIGCLLVSHVSYIALQPLQVSWGGLWGRWRCIGCLWQGVSRLLWCLALSLPRGAILLDDGYSDRGSMTLLGVIGTP